MSPTVLWLTAAALAAGAGWAVLMPRRARRSADRGASGSDETAERRRALLRQLRDLDDDRAAGKLDEGAYARLREPVVAQTAALLAKPQPSAGPTPRQRRGNRPTPPARPAPRVRRAGRGRIRLLAGIAAVATVIGSAAALLTTSVHPRGPGQTLSGGQPAAAAAPPTGVAGAPANAGGASKSATSAAANARAALEQRVRSHPRDIGAWLRLATADLAAGRDSDAANAYLAVLGQEPDNPAAGTGFALLLFRAGRTSDAEAAVSHVIQVRPDFPDAYYARGLIELMGRRKPAAAEQDLRRYLAAAPQGAHRPTAQALLQLIAGGSG